MKLHPRILVDPENAAEVEWMEFEAKFPASASDSGSVALVNLNQLADDVNYSILAWAESGTSSANGPSFTRADLAAAPVGTVFATQLGQSTYPDRSFTSEAFTRMVLADCSD